MIVLAEGKVGVTSFHKAIRASMKSGRMKIVNVEMESRAKDGGRRVGFRDGERICFRQGGLGLIKSLLGAQCNCFWRCSDVSIY